MILYPAIDLKNGKCVRLIQGKMNKETVFNNDPLLQAKSFVAQGCEWLHLVDLDGALSQSLVNQTIIKKIINPDIAPVFPNSKVVTKALGISATIPEKIINEIPLPIPLWVICSPNHIKKIVPATIVVTVVTLKNIPGLMTKFSDDSNPTDKP